MSAVFNPTDATVHKDPRDAKVGEGRRIDPLHPIRLMVLDDHPAVRWGLVQLLQDRPDFDVAAVATTAETAIGQAEHEQIDVAVVDYHLGGRNGLWVTRKLKALGRPPRVVIFSAFANDHLAASCAVAGVDALLSKGSLGSELCDAIRAVAHGRRLLPRVPAPMVGMLRRRLEDDQRPTFDMLLAGVPREDIRRALSIEEDELAAREAAILAKLEALPGELVASGPGRGGLSFERLIT